MTPPRGSRHGICSSCKRSHSYDLGQEVRTRDVMGKYFLLWVCKQCHASLSRGSSLILYVDSVPWELAYETDRTRHAVRGDNKRWGVMKPWEIQ